MNYLKVETNSLVDLAGRAKNGIDWDKMGTNAKAINLSPIRNQIQNKVTNINITMVPVIESGKAEMFIQECKQWGVEASIITQEEAEQVLADNFVPKEV